MTRCTEKTLAGKRCKNSVSHDGKCMMHVGSCISRFLKPKIISETAPAGMKECGHTCNLTTVFCCSCSDNRPLDTIYYRYVDTVGDVPTGFRDDGYCDVCHHTPEEHTTLNGFYAVTHKSIVSILSRMNRNAIEQVVKMAMQEKRSRIFVEALP